MSTPKFAITYTTQSGKRSAVRTPTGLLLFTTINDALYRAARLPWDQDDDPAVAVSVAQVTAPFDKEEIS